MLEFRSKARTLQSLSFCMKSAEVLEMCCFSCSEYLNHQEETLLKIMQFDAQALIVRSSSLLEDSLESSLAGQFESVLNVPLEKKNLHKAIMQVADSLDSKDDEIFVQPMLQNVSMSGVVLSADIDTQAPYYIINYEESGSTTGVTSGQSKDIKTFISLKSHFKHIDPKIDALVKTCQECETLFAYPFLDIEFAFSDEKLYILQVRPIVFGYQREVKQEVLENALSMLYKKIKKLNAKHPKLLGQKSIFGVMPDWNPAEIIGIKPKPLALSLYKELITDTIWAYQRDNYGYRRLRSYPLMVSFLGMPFIDVRVSFNSFIPKRLNEQTASKLVDYYLNQLASNRKYHDKVEFQIVLSCSFFGLDKRLELLQAQGFSQKECSEIKSCLLELTNNIIDVQSGLYKKDLLKIKSLAKLYDEVMNSELSMVDKIYWLMEDCKRYGALPFAGVARAAFIAMQILTSLESEGILDSKELDLILNSFETVSKRMVKDKARLSKEDFLKQYGHLRPGTYDILSKRYDEAYDEYFSSHTIELKEYSPFEFTDLQKQSINSLLQRDGLNVSFEELMQFIEESIVGREQAKFIFTKHLSEILRLIEKLAKRVKISKEDIAYLDYQSIKRLYATLEVDTVGELFNKEIQSNQKTFELTQALKLPSLIVNEDDIYNYTLQDEEPSFITKNITQAEVLELEAVSLDDLSGRIICIASADPGYDYLFSKNIAGLITCYGGANSHMAIRCAELGIPAVIGCGELSYGQYKEAKVIQIDTMNRKVTVIQ